jgi:hypothetical protein
LFSANGDNQPAVSVPNSYSLGAAPSAHSAPKPFNGSNPALNNVAENVGFLNGHQANPIAVPNAPVPASAFEFHSRGSSPPSSHQRSPLPEQLNGEPQAKPAENNGADKAQVQKNQPNAGRPWQNNNNNSNNNNQDRRPRGFQFNNQQPQNRRQPGAFNQHHQGPNSFNRNNQQFQNNNNSNGNNNMMGYRRNQNGAMPQNGMPRPRNQQMGRPLPPNMRPQFNDFKRVARKFDPALKTDFDFEKANQEFIDLENKLGKLNVCEPEAEQEEEEKQEVEESKSGDEECYDKKKSFFDKISCEAIERSKGSVFKLFIFLTATELTFFFLFCFEFTVK